MATRTLRIICAGAIIVLVLALTTAAINGRDNRSVLSNNTEQQAEAAQTTTEQIKDNDGGDEEVAPNLNTQEFKMTASNVNCSTTNINGVESRSCSGNVGVIPRAQADMNPQVYKLNEQTKLWHNGAEENLTNLQQLSQANAYVTLTLVPGSSDMLAEIRY